MSDSQRLQDMLVAMQQQRDQALNALVISLADVTALKRAILEKDSKINELSHELESTDI